MAVIGSGILLFPFFLYVYFISFYFILFFFPPPLLLDTFIPPIFLLFVSGTSISTHNIDFRSNFYSFSRGHAVKIGESREFSVLCVCD